MGNSKHFFLLATLLTLLIGQGSAIAQDSLILQDSDKPEQTSNPPSDAPQEADAPDETKTVEPGVGSKPSVAALQITRRTVENFLTDPLALVPFGGGGGEEPMPLVSTFVIAAEGTPYSIIWDPTACRLLGIYRTPDPEATTTGAEPPSPYVFLAEGPTPFSTTSGVFGNPSYFGFRVVDGYPEFLYHHGRLLIEERIWLDTSKNELMQQFTVKNASDSISLKFPEDWKERITSSSGEWEKGTLLEIPAGKDGEERTSFVLSYALTDGE